MNAKHPTTLPNEATELMQRAVGALQRGNLAAAAPLFGELNRRWPDLPDAWHFHGLLRHQQGASEEALALLERAEALASEHLPFLLNHARVLIELNHREQALQRLRKALTLAPADERVLAAIAQLLLETGRGGTFTDTLEHHLERSPRNWQLWVFLAQCLEQGGAPEAALAAFEKAAKLAPSKETAPLVLLGESARHSAQGERAEDAFKRALERDPNVARARLGLGNLAMQRGDFAEAESQLRTALSLAPDMNGAWEALSIMASGEAVEPLVRELDQAIEAAEKQNHPHGWLLNFSRARLRERLGDYDGAFADYTAGNRPRAPGDRYSREIENDHARDVIGHLDRDFVARPITPPPGPPQPIFICGMFRSGTSLVESIFASHPEIRAGGEMLYVHDRILQALGYDGLGHTGTWLADQSDAELRALALDWQAELRRQAGDCARITDKLPGNYSMLGFIHACFPEAPIIHVRRDARDNCFSCFATPFQTNYLPSSTLQSTGHFYRLYETFMAHWREVLGAERIIEVQYEQLVAEPEGEIRRLLAAAGLPWDRRCLDFHRNEQDVRTASVYQVRQPLYTSSIGRWRHFESHLAPLIAELNGPSPL